MRLIFCDKPVDYLQSLKFFEDLSEDKIYILEHKNVYTAGKSVKNNKNERIHEKIYNTTVFYSDRGGLWTWHGIGQIVVYFVYNLKKRHLNISDFMSSIEDIVVKNIKLEFSKYDKNLTYNIYADHTKRGFWYKNDHNVAEKMGFIGLRVTNGCVLHGISINYNNDLQYFNYINPCGLGDVKITSMQQILKDKCKKLNNLDINNFKLNLGNDLLFALKDLKHDKK